MANALCGRFVALSCADHPEARPAPVPAPGDEMEGLDQHPSAAETGSQSGERVYLKPAQVKAQGLTHLFPDEKIRCDSVDLHGHEFSTKAVWDNDRRTDLPRFEFKVGGRTRNLSDDRAAILYLTIPTGVGRETGETYGTLIPKNKANWVNLAYALDSQHPAVTISITRTSGEVVSLKFFAGHIASDEHMPLGISFLTSNDRDFELPTVLLPTKKPEEGTDNDKTMSDVEPAKQGEPAAPVETTAEEKASVELDQAIKRAILFSTTLELRPARDMPAMIWDNISPQELERLRTAHFLGEEALSDPDRLIGALQQCSRVSAFVSYSNEAEKSFKGLAEYLTATMALCNRHGYFWFYQIQFPEAALSDPRINLEESFAPRWLARSSLANYQGGKCTELSNVEWASFRPLRLYPDAQTFAFFCRLAIVREKQAQLARLAQMIDSDKADIHARFRPFPGHAGKYVVGLYAHDPEYEGDHDAIYPVPDTLIQVDVSEGLQRKVSPYHGIVIEDQFGTRANFVAVVTGPPIERLTEKRFWKVTVEIKDDATSTQRHLTAIEMIQAGHDRQYGVDLPALVLGAPPMVKRPNWLEKQFEDPEKLKRFSDVLAARNLNESQQDAVLPVTMSDNSVVLIQGPPGTGKTTTDMAMVEALVACGETVLVGGPSGTSVNAAHERFKRMAELDPFEYVRFTGFFSKGGSKKAREAIEIKNVADVEDLIWELIEELATSRDSKAEVDDTFASKFQRIVCHWATNECPNQANSQALLQLQQDVKDPQQRDQLKENRKRMKNLTLKLAQAYLAVVKVVFVTCNTSVHDLLADFFRPSVVMIEESAQATVGDLATPLAVFKEFVKLVILSGDHKQLAPVVTSGNRNEGFDVLRESLFKRLAEEHSKRYHFSLLGMQYRMHPDIADPISEIFYQGTLKSAPITRELDDLQRTLQETFAPLKPAWNGHFRMALDVSRTFGSDAESKLYGNTTSKWNKAERDFVVSLVEGLVMFEPEGKNTRRITPEDIAIVTPYTGQRRAIVEALLERNKANAEALVSGKMPNLLRVKVASTTRMQGNEAPIVILSLVSNDPEKPSNTGFIYQSQQLNVEMSRAQKFLLVVGNLGPWVQDRVNNAEWLMQRIQRKHFAALLMDLFDREDIIALPDWKLAYTTGETRKPTGLFYKTIKVSDDHAARHSQAGRGARGRGRGTQSTVGRKQKFDQRLSASTEQPDPKRANHGEGQADPGEGQQPAPEERQIVHGRQGHSGGRGGGRGGGQGKGRGGGQGKGRGGGRGKGRGDGGVA